MNYGIQAKQTRERETKGIKRSITLGFSIGGTLIFLLSVMSSIGHN